MMKKLPWLPEYAKAEDASTFLEVATGEAWPLARILEAGAGAFVLIAPPEGTPQAVIDAVFGGRSGGFYGPILRQDDLHRLVSSPGDATMHVTQTPEGRVISSNPPARFTSAEVRLYAADVRRIAEMFPDHEVTPSRHSETLRLDGFDVTFAEGHSLRQFMHPNRDIARIDLLESPPAAQSPEPVAAPRARAMKTPQANEINALHALREARKPDGSPMFDLMAIPAREGRKSPAKQYVMQHLGLSTDAAKLALGALERDGEIKYADPVKKTR